MAYVFLHIRLLQIFYSLFAIFQVNLNLSLPRNYAYVPISTSNTFWIQHRMTQTNPTVTSLDYSIKRHWAFLQTHIVYASYEIECSRFQPLVLILTIASCSIAQWILDRISSYTIYTSVISIAGGTWGITGCGQIQKEQIRLQTVVCKASYQMKQTLILGFDNEFGYEG